MSLISLFSCWNDWNWISVIYFAVKFLLVYQSSEVTLVMENSLSWILMKASYNIKPHSSLFLCWILHTAETFGHKRAELFFICTIRCCMWEKYTEICLSLRFLARTVEARSISTFGKGIIKRSFNLVHDNVKISSSLKSRIVLVKLVILLDFKKIKQQPRTFTVWDFGTKAVRSA